MTDAEADPATTDRGDDDIELESGVDDVFPRADALDLLRIYIDIPGNTMTERVHRKCVDFNVRTLLVSKARLSTALKAWPIQLHFGVLGFLLVQYFLIKFDTDTYTHHLFHCTCFLGIGVMAMLLKHKQVVSVIYDASLNTTNLLAARRDTTITRATVSAVRFRPRLLRGGQHIGIALVPRNAGCLKMGDTRLER